MTDSANFMHYADPYGHGLTGASGAQGGTKQRVVTQMKHSLDAVSHWLANSMSPDAREMAATTHALKLSEARFVALFDNSPSPMAFCRADDGFASTQWNLAFFELFGLDPTLAQNKSGLELSVWVDPADRQHVVDTFRAGRVVTGAEFPMRRADGALLWVSLSSRNLVEPETMVLLTFVDITARKQAQEALAELNAQLEGRVMRRTSALLEANADLTEALRKLEHLKDQLVQSEKLVALGALVAGVAHELNTPIGNSLTVASAMEDKVDQFEALMSAGIRRSDLAGFAKDARAAATMLVRNLTRAADLIMSFKQVAVIEKRGLRISFALADVVRAVVANLSEDIKAAGCTVVLDIPDGLELAGYPEPVAQVFSQLIENALVHGFDGAGIDTIVVRAHTVDDHRVQAEVIDNGHGIAPDQLHRVFEPYYTTRLGRGGNGLGLFIVHNIVTGVLEGHIALHSAPGQGTHVVLTVPLAVLA